MVVKKLGKSGSGTPICGWHGSAVVNRYNDELIDPEHIMLLRR